MSETDVVIIGPAFPLRGGIANLNEALSLSLNKNNISNIIFSFSLQYPNILFPGKTQFDENGKIPEGLNVNTCINSINPFNWFWVAYKIIKLKPKKVVVRYWLPFMAPCLGTICRLIRTFSNIEIIAITDNIIPHEKRFGDKILTKYFVGSCDAFITMSKTVLKELEIFTDSKRKMFIPHPIYNIFGNKISMLEARNNLQLETEDKIILFFGFIRKYKGLELLLKAMTNPQIRSFNIKLIIAGEFYEFETETLEFINQNNLTSSIILHNHFIDSDKVKNYFCAADMVVQPYITATQSGITQIAYQFDTPMLVTNVGGLSEIVEHNKIGYVVDVNEDAIANSILDFYINNRREEFSKNVALEASKFSWQNLVDGIMKI
jgi:glycosyltransferase involved in cell wall biosynthesis